MSKVWVITGAGSGIGAATATAALKAGDYVVATGRNIDKLHKALSDVVSEKLAFVQLDVTNEAQAKNAIEQAVQQFGRVDVLVNNAGYSFLGNFEEMTMSDLEDQFAPNFYGVVHLMRAALPVMRKQRAGHIINISSVAGVVGLKHCSAYAASKFALEGLSLSLATEVEQFGIKITLVEPGFFRTDLLDANNIKWGNNTIEDYASEGSVEAMWAPYNGTQPNDPAKLGDALVTISQMEKPPQIFVAGSDALTTITTAVETRLQETRAYVELSSSTLGDF